MLGRRQGGCRQDRQHCGVSLTPDVGGGVAAPALLTAKQQLEAELDIWAAVNDHISSPSMITLAGRPALRMPYVGPVCKGECDEDVVKAVWKMASQGFWHKDLHWRHVCRAPVDGSIVFIDFGACDAITKAQRQDAFLAMLSSLSLEGGHAQFAVACCRPRSPSRCKSEPGSCRASLRCQGSTVVTGSRKPNAFKFTELNLY